MKSIKEYPISLGDVIQENFSVDQIKQYIYFDKIPRLIFRLKKDSNELKDYERLENCISSFNGFLKWGMFKGKNSKINYVISPVKWNEIENKEDFRGEHNIINDPEYLEILDLAIKDYQPLVRYLKSGL